MLREDIPRYRLSRCYTMGSLPLVLGNDMKQLKCNCSFDSPLCYAKDTILNRSLFDTLYFMGHVSMTQFSGRRESWAPLNLFLGFKFGIAMCCIMQMMFPNSAMGRKTNGRCPYRLKPRIHNGVIAPHACEATDGEKWRELRLH